MYTMMIFAPIGGSEGVPGVRIVAYPRDFPSDLEFVVSRDLPSDIEKLSFAVDTRETDGELPDFIEIAQRGGVALCSLRLLTLLREVGAKFAAYPAHLRSTMHAAPIGRDYEMFVPQRLAGTIDWDRSATWTEPRSGRRYVTDLMLTPEVEASAPAVFCPDEKVIFLAHERVQRHVEGLHYTGIAFVSLDVIHQIADAPAKSALERRLADEPENAATWGEYAHLLWRLHHAVRALEAADRALSLRSDLGAVWHTRGLVLASIGRYEEAVTSYRRAFELEPSSAPLTDCAVALLSLGRVKEAYEIGRRAASMSPEAPRPLYLLGQALSALGRYAEAVRVLEQVTNMVPGAYPEAYGDLGNALAQLGQYESALAAYNRGLDFLRDDAMWRGKAAALHALNRTDDAFAAEDQALSIEHRRQEQQSKLPL